MQDKICDHAIDRTHLKDAEVIDRNATEKNCRRNGRQPLIPLEWQALSQPLIPRSGRQSLLNAQLKRQPLIPLEGKALRYPQT